MIFVAQLIDDQCALNPGKVAIKHAKKTFTYHAVNELSNRLARFIAAQNISPIDILGIAVERSPEMIVLLLAVVKAGAAYLPIDHNFPHERIGYMLANSSVKTVITSKKLKAPYQDYYHVIFIEDALLACSAYDASNLQSIIEEDSLAYILYTSGSTGNPKGVAVTHGGLSNLLLSIQQLPGMQASDIMLHTTTISFDIAELEIYLPLISGATVVIADAEAVKDGRSLLEIAETEKITVMQGTPFMWRTMLEAGWSRQLAIKVFCGGEAMTKELAKKLLPRCTELWNMYGPTETTIYSIIKRISEDNEVITIGKPIDHTQVYILDASMNKVLVGETGEIYIAGAGVAKGYINKPELTAEKFVADPFAQEDGKNMYRTGDLGKFLANGDIQCLGRIDHQVKIRGYRIETEEIEYQLQQQKNIEQALVVSHEDAMSNVHLVAYLVLTVPLKTGNNADFYKKLKNVLGQKLPVYMVPDTFMVIDAIPLMANGKTDRKLLPNPLINQHHSNDYEGPQTETEIALSKICLKSIAIDKIGVNDNLFELGINSLIAVSIMVQVEKQFGKRLPLSILLKHPTIRQLALVVQDHSHHSPYKMLVAIKPEGTKIPVYIVHGIGLNLLNLYNMVSNLSPDQPVYGLQSIGLDGNMKLPGTMEEIARFYNDEILKNDPIGPYAIAGYSFGGYIAFEMVKQLQAMGKEVKLLAMFDSNLQVPSHQYPVSKKLKVKLIRQFKKIGFRLYTIFNHPVHLAIFLKSNSTKRFKSFLNKIGVINNYDPESLPDFMQDIARELSIIFQNYEVKPYKVKVDIFKAGVRMYYIDDPKMLGWGEYALDGVEVHEVPGDHKEMFDNNNSQILAKILQSRLDRMVQPL